jgi:hypothetical protein
MEIPPMYIQANPWVVSAAYLLIFGGIGSWLLFRRLPPKWYRGFYRVVGFLLIASAILNVFGYLHFKL